MKTLNAIVGMVVLAASAVLMPSASAQSVAVLTVGSSAQFGPFAVAAYALATANGTTTAYHYTVKSTSCASGSTTCYASVADSRNSSIPNEPGNLWVVWNSTNIWAYLSVDSTVGIRAFSATPRATLALASLTSLPVSSTSNYTTYWPDGTADTALTSTVYAALSGVSFTAANTDILPVDALFATNRSLNSLGYGSVADTRTGHTSEYLIGNAIASHFSTTSTIHPVSFALAGSADPFSGTTVPTQYILPIGAAPVVFLANTASGSTVASVTNITSANAASLFSGNGNCASSLLTNATGAITPILREPLSGTMNTAEYTVFVPGGYSQETGITTPTVGSTQNPLALTCGSGYRYRAIGTGDEVKAVVGNANTVGYAFFSYESVNSSVASGSNTGTYKYLTLNSVDPINSTYSTGTLPAACTVSSGEYTCGLANGASFPNLRNGTYPAWSVYRMITDASGQANAQTLVNKAEALVSPTLPDFVPFSPVCGSTSSTSEPGLKLYREHFVPSTVSSTPDTVSITADDGSLNSSVSCSLFKTKLLYYTLGGGTEAGGDVGGTVVGPNTTSPTYPGATQTATH